MTTQSRTVATASIILSLTAIGFAGEAIPFDAVKTGVFGVYTIDDMTTPILDDEPSLVIDEPATKARLAEQIGSLIRDTISVGLWTTNGGNAAAMMVTPNQITIKASAETQRDMTALLSKLREQRELFVRSEYRVVESTKIRDAFAKATPGSTFVQLDEQTAKDVGTDAKDSLSESKQIVHNGADRLWVGTTGGSLPTLHVQPVISADRKSVTLIFNSTGGERGHDLKKVAVTIPSGGTAAIPLNDQCTQWLLFKAEALRQELQPA